MQSRSCASASPRSWQANIEAARSLGLHRLQLLRLVTVPQVFRIELPTLGNQIVSVVLDSAQASIIGAGELTYQTQSIGSSTFVICFSLSQAGRRLERRTARELQPSTATVQPAPSPALAMARRPTKNASGAVTTAMDGREAL